MEFIGFQVATTLLERAFRETYCLELTDVIRNVALSVGSYRHALSKTIPLATKVAWAQREDEIRRSEPGITRSRFLFNMSRSSYHKEWGYAYQAPGLWSRILAFILKLVPKIGPLRALKFHMPTPEVERMFMQSFNVAVTHYRDRLNSVASSSLVLPDINFDTGDQVRPAVYNMVDKTYADLIERLAKKKFAGVDDTAERPRARLLCESAIAVRHQEGRKEMAASPSRPGRAAIGRRTGTTGQVGLRSAEMNYAYF